MTLFFLLNPKQFTFGGLPADADPIKRRHTEEEERKDIEIVDTILEAQPEVEDTHSTELARRFKEYRALSTQIEAIDEHLRNLDGEIQLRLELQRLEAEHTKQRALVARLILEMQEEEEALLMLLIQ